MLIKNIKCDQFAGMRKKDIDLSPNLNIIYGENESGKSTLVELVRNMLFRSVDIGNRAAADVDFKNRFIPTATSTGITGDHSDGEISFQHNGQDYRLEKTWGAGKKCTLDQGGTSINDVKTVDNTIKEFLSYGKGIYDDLIFPTQHDGYATIRSILDIKDNDLKTDLSTLVSQAVTTSGGVTADKLRKAIDDKLSELGEKWDHSADRPTRAGLTRGTGAIYQANVAYEQAAATYKETLKAEQNYNTTKKAYEDAEQKLKAATDIQESFEKVYEQLKKENDINKDLTLSKQQLAPRKEAAEHWNEYSNAANKANVLQIELSDAELIKQLKEVQELSEKIKALKEEIAAFNNISRNDVAAVKELDREIEQLKGKLRINIAAKIKKLGDADIRVISELTGEELDIKALDINEAVLIKIPDVMEMRISPKDINVDEINAAISERTGRKAAVLEKFGVDSIAELEERLEKCNEKTRQLTQVEGDYQKALGTMTYEQLSESCDLSKEVRSIEAIMTDIRALCGEKNIVEFAGRYSALVEDYANKYDSISENDAEIKKLSDEIAEKEKALSEIVGQIDDSLRTEDPDGKKAELKDAVEAARKDSDDRKAEYIEANTKFVGYSDKMTEAKDLVDDAKAILDEKKELYRHWTNIKAVFENVTANIQNNPMQGISDNFKKYLLMISNNRLNLDGDMDASAKAGLLSGNNKVGFEHLSEGTKDTVALALRLAVLNHLFPNGGGIAVFDDPFTDMDDSRRDVAMRLITEFAKDNQVIFTTCSKYYNNQNYPTANIINI